MSAESVVTRLGMLEKSFHVLTLKPAMVIHNLLPVAITIAQDVRAQTNYYMQGSYFPPYL